MPLDAPAPAALHIRRAEDADEILLRIALQADGGFRGFVSGFRAFDLPEHFFQRHDGGRFGSATEAEAGIEQSVGEQLLLRRHFLQRQAFALARDEVPVDALFVFKTEGGLGLLLRSQHGEEECGDLGHLLPGLMGADGDGGKGEQACAKQGGKDRANHGWD